MKLFADENVGRRIVAWLRDGGHDVSYALEIGPATADIDWLGDAEAEGRLILTADKDFGDLIFRDRLSSHGVVLLRLGEMTLEERISRLTETWSVVEANPVGRFLVISPTKVRVRNLEMVDDDD